jgi:hypothetical protein
VTDAGGLSTSANIELYLSNANVAPVVPGGTCNVSENSPENTVRPFFVGLCIHRLLVAELCSPMLTPSS